MSLPNATAGSTFSPLIQLIDDDEAVRDALSLLIGTVGLRVQPWADPQAFLQGFDRQAIGAIVLDVRMPGISGLTVLETLVSQLESGELPLEQLLSGYQRGAELLKFCRGKLDAVEKQIKVLYDGVLRDFSPDGA